MRLTLLVLLLLIGAGFAVRLTYLATTHPFFDEYVTVLAARQILQEGWPVLPSGLFYEHGLLATYLAAPFAALFIETPLAEWQPAHWRLMLARWPSLLVSTATIPLIYALAGQLLRRPSFDGHQISKQVRAAVGLLAAGLFALSPEGMVWGGRARMYALAALLVLLTVYWAYRGSLHPAPARYRWLALGALLLLLLTQFGALMMVPPLLIAMLAIAWYSRPTPLTGRSFTQPWHLLAQLAALAAITGLAVLVKRLGQPLGAPTLGDEASGSLLTELAGTVAYQTTFFFTWADTEQFLARQFGVPHHYWLALLVVAGWLVALVVAAVRQPRPGWPNLLLAPGSLFVTLIFGLIILEMVTLLEPFRRNPRYIVMFLPLFYLIASIAAVYLLLGLATLMTHLSRLDLALTVTHPITSLMLIGLFAVISRGDLRVALLTPEPAYEEALAHIHAEWQPGDVLLTMNTPAAGLYLGRADGFTIQNDAGQFLLETPAGPVDRWLGAPWLGRAADFAAALNQHPRVWFVIDTIRQPVYFRGDWLALLNSQMEQVWAADNALVYRSRPDRLPLSTAPAVASTAALGDSIRLLGYTLNTSKLTTQPSELTLTLFWQPTAPLSTDYTTFVHLRDAANQTVAQRDGQPLEGSYPTSQWQPGETVIDPITLPLPTDLPPGQYRLVVGLYRLDTLERLPVAGSRSGEDAVILSEVTLDE